MVGSPTAGSTAGGGGSPSQQQQQTGVGEQVIWGTNVSFLKHVQPSHVLLSSRWFLGVWKNVDMPKESYIKKKKVL
jgi:hypothetical protein